MALNWDVMYSSEYRRCVNKEEGHDSRVQLKKCDMRYVVDFLNEPGLD